MVAGRKEKDEAFSREMPEHAKESRQRYWLKILNTN